MNTLILAAGRGTRISRYLDGKPKCTVDVGGKELIKYTVDLLKAKGIKEIGIVLGYRDDAIRTLFPNNEVKFFYNPFYDVTNSIASCWFAKDFINSDDDLMIMNGDVFIEEAMLDLIIKEKMNPVLFSDESKKEEADYKLFYENNILKKYGKELKGSDITGEYIGIAKMNTEYVKKFYKHLCEMICQQKHSVWWENVLYELSESENIFVKNIENNFWAEVDYIEDYERIQAFLNK